MDGELTLEELSARTGEPVEALRRWRDLGLIGSAEAEGFGPEDVERARLVQMLLRRGIPLEMVSKVEAERGFLDRYMRRVFPEGARTGRSLAEAAETAGLDLATARRFWEAAGLGDQGDLADEDDVDALRGVKRVLDAGFPEDGLLQAVRVWADTLGRASEAGQRSFHIYVHERLRTQGLSGEELIKATDAAGDQATSLTKPVLLYFHRKGWERAVREDIVLHLAEEAGLTDKARVPGQLPRAVAFVDLSSFTPLTEAMGDEKAAEVLERFSALVRRSTVQWDGPVVKQIGDAFMLVFPDARMAVACALEIEARTAAEPQFPASRSGVHWGEVLYREGDYVGTNVNVASRLAVEAGRHQVLVTSAVRDQAKGLTGVEFARLGKRRLKGLASELALFEARRAGPAAAEKHIDPVCGMEMTPDEVAARLTLEGIDHCFCSDECLRRFVAAPEKYGG